MISWFWKYFHTLGILWNSVLINSKISYISLQGHNNSMEQFTPFHMKTYVNSAFQATWIFTLFGITLKFFVTYSEKRFIPSTQKCWFTLKVGLVSMRNVCECSISRICESLHYFSITLKICFTDSENGSFQERRNAGLL